MQIFRFLSQNQDKIVLVIGAILIAAIGFAAGRLTTVRPQSEPIVIEEPEQSIAEGSKIKGEALEVTRQTEKDSQSEEKEQAPTEKLKENKEESEEATVKYIGSKSGKKYHYPDCRYGKKIKEENQVWFKSAKEAQEAGYEPCKVCKPPTD